MRRVSFWLFPLVMASVIWIATLYPYVAARLSAPPGYQFSGQVAMANDTSMYFSFIHQAAQGHWLFRNDLTHVPSTRVMFNPQWLAVGRIMSWFGLSESAVYQVWRAAGAVSVAMGFAVLAWVFLKNRTQHIIAQLMFLLGAGFSWLLYAVAYAGLLDLGPRNGFPTPAIDLVWGVHPFSHIMKNPHFSFPHGLFLLVIAYFALGEKTKRIGWYAASAAIAVLEGFSRPYDLITLWGVLGAFIALEVVIARRLDMRLALMRCVPLLATGPVLLYFVWLFSINKVFKYWASQGSMPVAPLHWHVLSFGIAFVLFAIRLALWRRLPLTTSEERLLAVWAIVLFCLFHSYRVFDFMPYSPQLGVPLVAPMLLLGLSLIRFEADSASGAKRLCIVACAVALVAVNALGSALLMVRAPREAFREFAENYTRNDDLVAFAWLNQHAHEDDIILSTQYYGNRMSKYVAARYALAHWSVTPRVADLNGRVADFFAGRGSRDQMLKLLTEISPRWIYLVQNDTAFNAESLRALPGMREAYSNPGVIVFEWNGT